MLNNNALKNLRNCKRNEFRGVITRDAIEGCVITVFAFCLIIRGSLFRWDNQCREDLTASKIATWSLGSGNRIYLELYRFSTSFELKLWVGLCEFALCCLKQFSHLFCKESYHNLFSKTEIKKIHAIVVSI